MSTVITYGTFDVLHHGHIQLLKRAKSFGDYLIVGCSSDEFNQIKNKQCYYRFEQRKILLEALRYVDLVIPEYSWEQKTNDIINYSVNTFVMGDDWTGKFDFLQEHCRVLYLPRTPDVCSSKTKAYIARQSTTSQPLDFTLNITDRSVMTNPQTPAQQPDAAPAVGAPVD